MLCIPGSWNLIGSSRKSPVDANLVDRYGHEVKLNSEERSEAIFGAFDGVVSVIGFVFGLLVHHSLASAIAVGRLGGAIAATISMTTGEYESREGSWKERIGGAGAMRVATFVGSLVPVWSFFIVNLPALADGASDPAARLGLPGIASLTSPRPTGLALKSWWMSLLGCGLLSRVSSAKARFWALLRALAAK